jgi:hypothetical protein
MAQLHPNPFLPTLAAPPVAAEEPKSARSLLRALRDEQARDPFRAPAEVAGSEPHYVLVRSGPEPRPEECEIDAETAIEITILWGSSVVHVAHLAPPRAFYVGEDSRPGAETDFLIPSEKHGAGRAPLVLVDGGMPRVVVPAGATGTWRDRGERRPLEQVADDGEPCAELAGARTLPLARGARAEIRAGDFTYRIAAVARGKPVARGLFAATDRSVPAYFGLSLLAHAAMVGALTFFTPPLGVTDDEGVDKDRLYALQAYLAANAEREQEAKRDQKADEDQRPAGDTSGGEAARGESGAMGKPDAPRANRKAAWQGPKDTPDVSVPREAALREAQDFGLIGILNRMNGMPNAVTAPWGSDAPIGHDPFSAIGGMWGDELGESGGGGGLSLSGLGEGGGGLGEGIGLNDINTCGKTVCPGLKEGFGTFHGRPGPAHATRSPRLRPSGTTTVTGHLPPEVIQRIVRQSYGRFRMCYERGLARNPTLEGRVAARFVIDRTGAVSNVSNGGSDLPDSGVVSCVISAYYGLSFPAPEDGIVTVVYPIQFSPG